MGRLRVAVLGPFTALCGDRPIDMPGIKPRGLLVLLAMSPGSPVSISRIIDGLWGEEPPDSVRNSVQVYATKWRRALREAGCDTVLALRPGGYVLEIEPEEVDALRFEHLLEVGRVAVVEDRLGVASHAFKEATGLLRGEVLQGFEGLPFRDWLSPRLEAERVQLEADRIDCLLGLGQGGELVSQLEALTVAHPLTERFRAQLMHALYRSGRQADAMRAFEQARLALADVGIEPGPALRAMEQAVLRQDPELDSQTSPFTPTRPPVPLTRLIGRDEEVARVVESLRESRDRLTTLTGPGGVGKTRFGIEVATRVAEEGWSPVAYTALTDVTDPAVVSVFINTAFGVPDSWKERPVRDVARMLGKSPLLVVIDGGEHMIDTVRTVVREMLDQGPRLRVLMTSRVPLGLAGERQIPVRPLPTRPSDPDASPREAPAVQLFIDRCERAGETTTFTGDEIQDIVGICERVDGLPFAIELAAARTGTLGVTGLRERLSASLDLLSPPGRPVDDRHGSLRAVIEWTHGLLDPQSQRLLARLSVFAGGFSFSHVEEMWPEEHQGQLLGSFEGLNRCSLMERVPEATPRRFRLLDTVAEFARERLRAIGETEDTYERLITWLRARLQAGAGRVGAGAIQFEPLEPDADNARAAVTWALEHATPDDAADLCTRMYVWWSACARGCEVGRWLAEVLSLIDPDSEQRAIACLYLGRIEGRLDHVVSSNSLLAEAVEIWRTEQDNAKVAHALTSLVENMVHQGRFAEAQPIVEEILAITRDSSDIELVCRGLHAACWLAGATRNLDLANTIGLQLARAAAGAGLVEFEAKTLADLAWIARLGGEHEVALDYGKRAMETAIRAGSAGGLVSAWTEIQLAEYMLGHDNESLQAAISALTCESGDDLSPSSILRVAAPLARLGERTGHAALQEQAVELVEAVLRCAPDVGVWPADVEISGEVTALSRVRANALGGPPAPTEVDLMRRARQLGARLKRELDEASESPAAIE